MKDQLRNLKGTDDFVEEDFNVRDGLYGVVTSGCMSGLFIELENGQNAFSHFGGLRPGTKVFCTVLKKASDKWRVLVAIDSVIREEIIA